MGALPLFLALRAAIRALVRAAAARQHDGDGAVRQEAGSYLDLALRLQAPPPARLVAVGGLSGTGKSTLASLLAPAIGAAPGARVLRSDALRKRAAGVAPEEKLPPSAYTKEAHAETYRQLLAEAETCLAAGHAVIADAVHARPEERAAIAALAQRLAIPFIGLWLEAPTDLLASRLDARRGDASDATVEIIRAQVGYTAAPTDWIRLDAAAGIDAVVDSARTALRQDGGSRAVSPGAGA